MLAELNGRSPNGRIVPLLSTAEELPFRTASLDLVTSFNSVHHFDLGRFLTAVARVLQPDGQLFIYTRTPQQNARTVWGRYFPDFTKHEQRLHSEAGVAGRRRADRRAQSGRNTDLQASALEHGRAAHGPGRGAPLLDILPVRAGRVARIDRDVPARLPSPTVSWIDEHLLVVVRSHRQES